MMSLWDALRMNMMISYQELVRTFPNSDILRSDFYVIIQETQNAHKNNSIKHLTTTQEFHIALFFNEKILFA